MRDTLPQITPHLRVGWKWPDALGAMRYPAFRWFFAGQIISLLGSWMQTTALQWLAYRLTGSVLSLGAVTFASFLPVLLFSLFMGVVVDRYPRRRLLMVTQSTFLVLAALLAYLTFVDRITYGGLLVFSLLVGLANSLDLPARQAFFSDLVEREDLLNAIALNSSVFNGTRILGPVLGGIVVATWGEAMAFFLNSLSFVAVLLALAVMRLSPPPDPAPGGGGLRQLRQGLGHVRRDRPVLGLVTMIAVFSLIGFPVSVLFPALADDILHLGVKGYGGLMAAMGVGALVAGIAIAVRGRQQPRARQLTGLRLAFAGSVAVLGLTSDVRLILGGLVVMGYALIAQLTVTNTLVQWLAPDSLRGRVVSAYTWALAGFWPLGALMVGAVGQRLGVSQTLVLLAIACAAATFVGGRLFPQPRQLDRLEEGMTPAISSPRSGEPPVARGSDPL